VRLVLAACAAVGIALPTAAGATTLVQVSPGARPLLRAAGAERISSALDVWRIESPALVGRLRADGLVRFAEPERQLVAMDATVYTDPLSDQQWWLAAVGVIDLTPPGPGQPVTVIDSGIDANHPEFVGRPDFSVLNAQTTFARDEDHGTEVASVVGAPQNGFGVVGIYPQAVLRVWDASPFRGITNTDAIAGLSEAAASGPGVLNLSWGSTQRDPLIEQAIDRVIRAGVVIVAASGNDRQAGAAPLYPASLPHVLTVAATDRDNSVAFFSSPSAALDLAAPGVDIPVADPFSDTGYFAESGTSFSSPIVAGASAWIWTARSDLDASQVFELMRRSATDLGPAGWDQDSGFGLLNVPAALAAPAPIRDPQEPNDDVALVAPRRIFASGTAVLGPAARLSGRLDAADDPRDVYRIRFPANRRVRVSAQSTDGRPVTVALWGAATRSVVNSNGRLARGAGAASVLVGKHGFTGYLELAVGAGRRTEYTLAVTTSGAR
jgi:subtilisin family serine protease